MAVRINNSILVHSTLLAVDIDDFHSHKNELKPGILLKLKIVVNLLNENSYLKNFLHSKKRFYQKCRTGSKELCSRRKHLNLKISCIFFRT